MTQAEVYELFEHLRWGGAPSTCPHCQESARCYFLRPADGISRRTRTGRSSARRLWKCAACRRQFTVLTGTVLQGTKVDLRIWLAVLAHGADEPRASSDAARICSELGLGAEAARVLARRVTAAVDAAASQPASTVTAHDPRAAPG